MKQIKFLIGSTTLFLLPLISFAQSKGIAEDGTGGEFGTLLGSILEFTNDILIPFIIGIGFLFFVWGMFQFFIVGGSNDEAKEKGKSLMIYATLGFVIIIVFWGIVNLLTSSTGLNDPYDPLNKPKGVEIGTPSAAGTPAAGTPVITPASGAQ